MEETARTPMATGSTGKHMTAIAVLLLVEEGEVGLDDPVVEHLPEFETAADQLGTASEQIAIERTEALLLVLGSAAFVSQALVGASIALLGVALMGRAKSSLVLGGVGVIAGAGWATGAVMINFAIIVPFTVLTWAWVVVLAVVVLRGKTRSTAAAHGSDAHGGGSLT